MYRKKKVNTGITRIFRQHKFLEFRNLNVYDENPNSNFDFWYLFLFYEVVAESKITLWMDIRIIDIVGKLKPDILKAHCQSIHGPIERNYNDWNGRRTNKWWRIKITFSRVNISCSSFLFTAVKLLCLAEEKQQVCGGPISSKLKVVLKLSCYS